MKINSLNKAKKNIIIVISKTKKGCAFLIKLIYF